MFVREDPALAGLFQAPSPQPLAPSSPPQVPVAERGTIAPLSRRITLISYAVSIGCVAVALLLFVAPHVTGQGNTLTLLSSEGRRPLPLAINDNQEFVSLDDLAAAFQFTVRTETGAVTMQRGSATIILTPGQALVSAAGRVVSLNPAPARIGGRVMVPLDFINRALGPAMGVRLDVRRASRLVVIGDLVVPRVTMRHEPAADSARLTLEATPRVASALTQEGNSLIVRFTADALDATAPQLTTQNFVTGVRQTDATTIAIDLGPRFASYRSNTETTQTSTRLVIDLLSTRADAPVITGPVAPAPPRPGTPPTPGTPAELPELVTRGPALTTLVIDPGHGGEDVGARGLGGTLEKDVTLSVARRLKALVESRLGVRVLLTRDDDRMSPLERRTALANNNKADVFLSLHLNASLMEPTRGASLHVAVFDDAQQARSSVVSERVPTFSGSTRQLDLLPWDVAQIRHMSRSSELADILGASLASVTQMASRPIERGSYRVLESANMAAVLIELGYVTNAEEEMRLASSTFQEQIAQALLDALVRYQQSLAPSGNDR